MLKYTTYDVVFQEIPDEVSLAFNISGCPFRCDGCHSSYLQQNIGEPLCFGLINNLLITKYPEVTCILFLGGDNNPNELYRVINQVYDRYRDKYKFAWYSGADELYCHHLLFALDYVKIGHYDKNLGGLDSKSTNQRLYKIHKGGEGPHPYYTEDITYRFWR